MFYRKNQKLLFLYFNKATLSPFILLLILEKKEFEFITVKEICDKAELKGSKVLVLAHRRLLLRQHMRLIKNARFESVFTEVNHLGENGNPDLIIIDEEKDEIC